MAPILPLCLRATRGMVDSSMIADHLGVDLFEISVLLRVRSPDDRTEALGLREESPDSIG